MTAIQNEKKLKMKIAGFRKTSLIDYPDNISAVLFTQGCNCRCIYCHNPELVTCEPEGKEYMDLDYFWNFLEERGHLLDGVVITGGEPTLQPGIIDFIDKIKTINLKVKLDTNGSNFAVVKQLVRNNFVDYWAVDVKASFGKYEEIVQKGEVVEDVKKSINLIKQSENNHEFRTTVVPGYHDHQELGKIAKIITGAEKYCIQNFRPDITLKEKLQEKRQFPEEKLGEFKGIADKYIGKVVIRN